MIPAADEAQLSKWLKAFYSEVDPSKLDNVPKIASIMISDQKALDNKLKAKHSKGLKYAAELSGDDLSKRKHPEDEEGSKKKMAKLVGAKRFVAPMPKQSEPEPKVEKSRHQFAQSSAKSREPPSSGPPRSQAPARPVSRPTPSTSSSPKKKFDQYALNDDQKAFLKQAKDNNMELMYEQYNPKNGGSASYDRYENYKSGRTVSEALKLGAKSADISYDYSRGFITFPDGGIYAKFRLMDSSNDMDRASSETSYDKGGKHAKETMRKGAEERSSSKDDQREKVISSKSSSSSAAFGITEDDMKEVKIEVEVVDYNLAGGEALMLAEKAFRAGELEECLEHLATVKQVGQDMILSEALRLNALVQIHTMVPTKSSVFSRNQMEDRVEEGDVKKTIHFADNLPTLRPEGSGPSRDLAKETRQENHLRHDPKGVEFLFETRLRDMLDDLFEQFNSGSALKDETNKEDGGDLVAVSFDFPDMNTTFKLHKKALLPASAKHLSENVKKFRGSDIEGMVELLNTAEGGKQLVGSKTGASWNGVNKYGKFGLTALSLAARCGKLDLVEKLLNLGAVALDAVDGATYLSEKVSSLVWIVELLRCLQALPSLVPPKDFTQLVRHTRKKGDTPLLVAVNNGDVAAARQLLEWGAQVESQDQKRSSDGATCYAVAQEKTTPGMLELLDEFKAKQ